MKHESVIERIVGNGEEHTVKGMTLRKGSKKRCRTQMEAVGKALAHAFINDDLRGRVTGVVFRAPAGGGVSLPVSCPGVVDGGCGAVPSIISKSHALGTRASGMTHVAASTTPFPLSAC